MTLSRGEVNRALRAFTIASGMWGAWGQMVGMGTAVFTGFVLAIGAEASDIAFLTSAAYVVAPVQILGSLFSHWIANKKRWVLVNGILEALFRCLLIVIPFLFAPSLHMKVLLLFLTLGLVAGYFYSPFYNSWVASTVPSHIRARFTSRQTIVSQFVGMAAGVVAGGFVDWFPEDDKMTAFIVVFLVGTVAGLAGHFVLYRAPSPHYPEEPERQDSMQNLIQPFRDLNFRRLIVFYASWNFAIGLSGPLFSVFMLDRLGFNYTTISLMNALGLLTTIIGYQVWSSLIDRYGGKPVMQILLIPGALNAIMWGLCQPGGYVMVSIAMAISGFIMSGIQIGVTPLLYGLLPQDTQSLKVYYLASWSTSINLIYALGPILGGILVASLKGVEYAWMGLTIGDIHILFLLSAIARLAPSFFLRSVEETRAISSRDLLANMFRGNLLSYAFHHIIFSYATAEDRRAKATWALGKSGNPMAIEQLVQALSDASPKVRSQAARALGETRSEIAVDTLIKELLDGASDIRSEAAEALGRLRHPRGIDPLVDALDDPDPRVQISAIRGLAEIGGDDVREVLFWYLSGNGDQRTFPTLVEALSQMDDQRIVQPALERLDRFPSSAIRYQLLNSVCRTLGGDGLFYRLLSMEEGRRFDELEDMIKHAAAVLTSSDMLPVDTRGALELLFKAFRQAHERNDIPAMKEQARLIAALIRDSMERGEHTVYDTLTVYVIIMAVNRFLASKAHDDLPAAQEIFLTVCLHRMAAVVQ